eukprot:2337010-Prymnesium_polylepis.1
MLLKTSCADLCPPFVVGGRAPAQKCVRRKARLKKNVVTTHSKARVYGDKYAVSSHTNLQAYFLKKPSDFVQGFGPNRERSRPK